MRQLNRGWQQADYLPTTPECIIIEGSVRACQNGKPSRGAIAEKCLLYRCYPNDWTASSLHKGQKTRRRTCRPASFIGDDGGQCLFDDDLGGFIALSAYIDAGGEVVGVYAYALEVEVFDFGVVAVDGDVGDGVSDFAGILEVSQTLSEDVGVDADNTIQRTLGADNNSRSKLAISGCTEAFFGQVDDRSSSLGYTVRYIDNGDLAIAEIARLVGDSSDILLIAYVEGGEGGAVYGSAEC